MRIALGRSTPGAGGSHVPQRIRESYDHQHPPAHFEARSPIQGTGRVIVEPDVVTGSRQRGASSSGSFGPRCQFGGIPVHGKKVIRLKLGIAGQDLLLGCPAGKPF